MFGNCPLWQRHWNGLLMSRIWLAGQIQWLELLWSGILFPWHTHWSGLLVSRTRSPGQKHSSGWLGLGTWLPGQPEHRPQVFMHFFHTFFLLHLFFFCNFLHFLGLFLSLHLPLLSRTLFSEKQKFHYFNSSYIHISTNTYVKSGMRYVPLKIRGFSSYILSISIFILLLHLKWQRKHFCKNQSECLQ